MSYRIYFSLLILAVVLTLVNGCQNSMPTDSRAIMSSQKTMSPLASQANVNGAGSDQPAYYDSMLFTINFTQLTQAEASLITHNGSINIIYTSDTRLPGNQPFISVLNAIQRDGFNPLWNEVGIVFNPGVTPHQFFSDNEVIAAASMPNPQITLDTTSEMYRCSVVGHK